MTAELKTVDRKALEARLETLKADQREQRQRVRDAADRARMALTRGDAEDDADAAIREQAEAEARLRAIDGAIQDLEKMIPEVLQTELHVAADRRMLGIKKSHGSLRSEYEEDVERVKATAEAFVEAIARINDRYGKLSVLQVEAEALAERFGLDTPDLPLVQPPVGLDEARAARHRVQGASLNGRFLPSSERARQKIVAKTPGGELIEAAGPTDAERKAAKEAERKAAEKAQKEREAMAPFAAEMERAKVLDSLNVPLEGRGFG